MTFVYPFSVFYLSRSVFSDASKKIKNNLNNIEFKFLLKSVLFHARYKKFIGTHVLFCPKDILDWAKTIEFEGKFKGLMEIGEDMVHSELNPNIRGNINFKLLQYATDKDGDVEGQVKIIVSDFETKKYFESMRLDKGYPIEIISLQEALVELDEIEEKIKEIQLSD